MMIIIRMLLIKMGAENDNKDGEEEGIKEGDK